MYTSQIPAEYAKSIIQISVRNKLLWWRVIHCLISQHSFKGEMVVQRWLLDHILNDLAQQTETPPLYDNVDSLRCQRFESQWSVHLFWSPHDSYPSQFIQWHKNFMVTALFIPVNCSLRISIYYAWISIINFLLKGITLAKE